MSFADHYPLAAFAEVCAIEEIGIRDEWRSLDHKTIERLSKNRKTIFVPALLAHLLELRSAGLLGATSGVKGRDIWQAKAWNKFVAGGEATADLVEAIGRDIIIRAALSATSGRVIGQYGKTAIVDQAEIISANWVRMCELFDEGTTVPSAWQIENLRDSKSGIECLLFLRNWNARLITLDDNHQYVSVEDAGPIPLVAAEFEMPSGQMLLTDILRVEGFWDGIKFDESLDHKDYSIAHDAGQAECTKGHAEHHGFGFTQTDNTSVVVHRHPVSGRIMVSERWSGHRRNEDADGDAAAPGWEKVGSFGCDIWRVTAIDRTTAANLMSAGGCDPAISETVLSDYLASKECYAKNIVRLEVTPGRWRIHSGPNFSGRVNRKKFGIPRHIKPWLILEPVQTA